MKKLITLTVLMATLAVTTQAALTPKQFAQVEKWAAKYRCYYAGIEADAEFGIRYFVFISPQSGVHLIAPISSDTADEAINAMIASAIVFRASVRATANQYDEGFADGAKYADTMAFATY
jgi:hypothetical protein